MLLIQVRTHRKYIFRDRYSNAEKFRFCWHILQICQNCFRASKCAQDLFQKYRAVNRDLVNYISPALTPINPDSSSANANTPVCRHVSAECGIIANIYN